MHYDYNVSPLTIVSPHAPLLSLHHRNCSVGMDMTTYMTAKLNQEPKTNEKDCDSTTSWSNLCHDILLLIIPHLGVIDFILFSCVCKLWRMIALSNRNMFMLSQPPLHVRFSKQAAKRKQCFLEDIEGRKFKTILPRSSERTCIGSVSGYLIMFGRETCDFRLVNLITRHELRFPRFPFQIGPVPESFRCALVFSPTTRSWVFVVSIRLSRRVSFAFSSKCDRWTHLCSDFLILDLQFFQGKVYALSNGISVIEVRLGSTPALIQVLAKTMLTAELMFPEFVTLGGKLCVIGYRCFQYETVEVNFDQIKWLNTAEVLKEYTCFASFLRCGITKLEVWKDRRIRGINERRIHRTEFMWYWPHKCLDVNLLHE
ncbi:hypothetical protein QVD17_20302 [Tagetes erecta]|uniref:F-box domain-containing protein n=1 Tax=Tagetes erecta TaxID=13708 RepID=A0AAD8KSK8_TARER|nr:hypothetical protein QVD17_20302 [Tagetes erecta]